VFQALLAYRQGRQGCFHIVRVVELPEITHLLYSFVLLDDGPVMPKYVEASVTYYYGNFNKIECFCWM
jgi:hypothetical protein